jgi:hypothetical protein
LVGVFNAPLHIAIGVSCADCYVGDAASDDDKAQVDPPAAEGIVNCSAQHVVIVTDFRGSGAGREVYLDDTCLEVRDDVWVVREFAGCAPT